MSILPGVIGFCKTAGFMLKNAHTHFVGTRRKDDRFEPKTYFLYVEVQIYRPDAANGRFSVHIAWFYAQKGPIARKDIIF